MMWQVDFSTTKNNRFDYLLLALVVLILGSIVTGKIVLFMLGGLLALYLLLYTLYEKNVGKKLILVNEQKRLRLFPEETISLTFHFKNSSAVPYLNGTFRFQLRKILEGKQFQTWEKDDWKRYEMPLTVMGKQEVKLKISLQAKRRGIARLERIDYVMPHLLNFDSYTLVYQPFYYTTFIVYPRLLEVGGFEEITQRILGEMPTNLSFFEDPLSPTGTRDYQSSDPFHRIHWKASAKSQHLQTMLVEQVIDRSFLFIVNLRDETIHEQEAIHPYMENILSYTAYLSQIATKKDLPFSTIINAWQFGDRPYLHLPKGQGQEHFILALEMLAHIPVVPMTYSFQRMVDYIQEQLHHFQMIVILGDLPENLLPLFQGLQVFHVPPLKGESTLRPLTKDVIHHVP